MSQWQQFLGFPTGPRLGSLSNGVIFGQILAFSVPPWLCDHTGRRFPIFVGSLLLVIGAVLQCAAQGYAMFLVSRMIIGFGGLIAVEASPMLVNELTFPTHRSVLVGYYNNLRSVPWRGASCVGHVWNLCHGAEHILGVAYSIPPARAVVFVYLLPESPRYLVQKDRYDEPREVLVEYHAGGDTNSPLVEFEMNEIILQIQTSKGAPKTGYREFLSTRGNLHPFDISNKFISVNGNAMASNYLLMLFQARKVLLEWGRLGDKPHVVEYL